MKTHSAFSTARIALFLTLSFAAVLLGFPLHAPAATWTGGNGGTWDTSATNWAGTAGVPPWDSTNGPGNLAQFNTADTDTAVLGANVYPGNLTFNNTTTVSGASSILYQATGVTKTFTVSPLKTATISSNINNIVGGDTSNILLVAGGGKLVLSGTTTLKSNTDNTSGAYFQVDGGSELEIQNPLFTFAPAANTGTRGSVTNAFLGNSSDNNIVRVTGTGRMVTGNFNFGTAGNDNNSVYVSAPGTIGTPSWDLRGNSAQLNMNSTGNLVQISNGAVMTQTSGGGTGKWGIGTSGSGGSNQMIVDGTNTSVNKSSSSGVEIGWGSNNNSLTIQNGGTWVGGRVEVGSSSGGGALVGSSNTQLITGTNSYFRLNGGTNTFFEVGLNSGSTGNSFQVANGGRADIYGTGTTRRFGVGQLAGADSNYVSITGAGAQLNFLHSGMPLVIGGFVSGSTVINSGGNLNHIDVYNGGTLYMDNTDNALVAPPANPNFTYGANPTVATALVLTGTNTSFNLGNGAAIATAKLGKTPGVGGGNTALVLNSTLNMNNGRLIAGASAPTTLISGAGTVNLLGDSYFSNSNAVSTLISSQISGAGDFFKEGTGTIQLSNVLNNYTGDTEVVAGTLRLDQVFLDDASDVYLDGPVGPNGKMNLAFVGTDTIAKLFLNGVQQAAGTYGRVGSTATFQNDDYFNDLILGPYGLGILNVTEGPGGPAVIPEPSTLVLAALGLAGLALVAWQRRRRT